MEVLIATDGACSGNPGPGGWGVVLKFGDKTRTLFGGVADTTNQRMELTAAIEGLKALNRPCTVTVISDSQYLIHAFTEGWLDQWQTHHWMTKKGPVANQDLWQTLLAAAKPHTIQWQWTKGHADHPLNQQADALARQGVLQGTRSTPSPAVFETPDDIGSLLEDPVTQAVLIEYLRTHPDLLDTILGEIFPRSIDSVS